MEREETKQKERIERTTFVLGIFSAGVMGFILNIFANVYYDVLVTGEKQFSKLDQPSLIFSFLGLVFVTAFLQFLIYDYQNEINLNRPFLRRFFDYFDTVFWFTQITKKINKIFLFIVKWTIIGSFAFAFIGLYGWTVASAMFSVFVLWSIVKNIYQRYYGK